MRDILDTKCEGGHVLCTGSNAMAEASRNLMLARGPDNVWDRQAQTSPYDQERWFAAAWGSALTMLGASLLTLVIAPVTVPALTLMEPLARPFSATPTAVTAAPEIPAPAAVS